MTPPTIATLLDDDTEIVMNPKVLHEPIHFYIYDQNGQEIEGKIRYDGDSVEVDYPYITGHFKRRILNHVEELIERYYPVFEWNWNIITGQHYGSYITISVDSNYDLIEWEDDNGVLDDLLEDWNF